jgi:hypothetical protein
MACDHEMTGCDGISTFSTALGRRTTRGEQEEVNDPRKTGNHRRPSLLDLGAVLPMGKLLMAAVSDSLSTLRTIKGVRNIFLFAGSEIIYSNPAPAPKKLVTLFRQLLPRLHQGYFQEMGQLEATEIHLASFKIMIYLSDQFSLVLLCEAHVDAATLKTSADSLIHDLREHKALQHRIKGIADS